VNPLRDLRILSTGVTLFTICRLPFTIPTVDDRTQREFLSEIEELVEQVFADIESLRRRPAKVPVRRELLARLFRSVHSIKGIAVTAGFNAVSELAQHCETLLDGARAGRISIEDLLIDILEDAANAISENLGAAAAGEFEPPPQALIEQITKLAAQTNSANFETRLPDLPSGVAEGLNEREKQLMLEAIRDDARLYLVVASFDMTAFDSQFQDLRKRLTQFGEVISTLPTTDNSQPERVGFRVTYSSDLGLNDLERMVGSAEVIFTALPRTPATAAQPNEATRPHTFAGHQLAAPTSFVRVDLAELDRLISSSHEVFSLTVEALDLLSNKLPADSRSELKNLAAQVRQSLVSLEQQSIELRMVSLNSVMQRAVRAGRVAARLAGKEIEFSVEGNDLRLDKVLCDAIANPLLHLVRNAVDHGIESEAERLRAGKNSSGRIRIVADTAGSRARVVVSDDGRGIDPELISGTAIRLGLVENDSVLNSDQSLRIIFRPGFSTAPSVSTVSGRGVGLDVVERAVEQAGGAVRVRSEPGKGADFEICLPAAFRILRALLITSGGFPFCLDFTQIVDRVEIDAVRINREGRDEALFWRGEMLPLTDMRRVLGQSFRKREGMLQVIICQFAVKESDENSSHSHREALVVDSIDGVQQLLVRSLGRHAARWIGVLGAADLGNGSVALVLNLPALLGNMPPLSLEALDNPMV
jgi:two-component system, chemotaxis family, sensor kinase CheA